MNQTSTVMDADLGRNYESEIVSDGSPDGAVWLGLDRRSFLATACVMQSEVQRILEEPEELQTFMQRAADTLGTDATAALALERIDATMSDKVGLERKHSSKPLPAANERLRKANEDLQKARKQHAEYLNLLEQSRQLEERKNDSDRRLRLSEAAHALRQAEELEKRFQRAKSLEEGFPFGPTLASEDSQLLRISETLQEWNNRPKLIELRDQSAAEIRQELNRLPEMPLGDLHVAVEVEQIWRANAQAKFELQLHNNTHPVLLEFPETHGASLQELNEIVDHLSEPSPKDDSELRSSYESLRKRKGRKFAMLVSGGLAVVIGTLLIFLGYVVLGTAILVAGVALVGIPTIAFYGLSKELRDAENKLKVAQQEVATRSSKHDGMVDWLREHQLPSDLPKLREIITATKEAEKGQSDLSNWTRVNSELSEKLELSAKSLLEILKLHGIQDASDPDTAFSEYQQACTVRAKQAAEASRREGLQRRLNDRLSLEAAAAEANTKRAQAEELLRAVANECGLSSENSQILASQFAQLKEERTTELNRRETEWSELLGLRGGKTLSELEHEAADCRSVSDNLGSELEEAELSLLIRGLENNGHEIANLQRAANRGAEELAGIQGQIKERQASLLSVTEAEEELEESETELERVRLLRDILEKTRLFLATAQERVHRDIAPVLSEAIKKRLASVTSGRYSDVRIDPETLSVKVCGRSGEWREAARLSHGTAEQVFLLLRVALAEYLTPSGEVCPLIIDDVTVHCDAERTAAILEALHSISTERQIILFSQEAEVLEWAEKNLHQPEDILIRLDVAEIPA
jgi:uncharacterized protein YhaN